MSGYTVPENPTDADLLHAYRVYSSPADPGLSGPTDWTLSIARVFNGFGLTGSDEFRAAQERVQRIVTEAVA